MDKLKEIFKHVLSDLEKIFPFFTAFYLASIFLGLFFVNFTESINWLVLHFVFVFFLVFFLTRFYKDKNKLNLCITKIKEFYFKIKFVRLFKLFLVFIVLLLGLCAKISFLSLFILIFGLLSFLFVWDSRISTILALLFLVVCAISLIFRKLNIAEQTAIISYYFLIITALTCFRELGKDKKVDKL